MSTDQAPRPLSLLTVILGIATIITFVMASPDRYRAFPMERMGVGNTGVYEAPVSAPRATEDIMTGSSQGMMAPDYYQKTADVTDTREFLKTYYNAQMKTRDVAGLARRVLTTVRGYEGRIDSESSAPDSAYVSFVVPQSKYDAFRTELESLVGSRFLEISISSQNKLGEKQTIEEQAASASSALAVYQVARDALVAKHNATVKSLQAQIDATAATSSELTTLKSKLASENAAYASKLSSSDANIKYAKDWQKAVANNDQKFLDDIATVNGTVLISYVSLWGLAQLYLPGYSIPAIFAVLTILSYLRDRRRKQDYV
jgi:hypothetical protein